MKTGKFRVELILIVLFFLVLVANSSGQTFFEVDGKNIPKRSEVIQKDPAGSAILVTPGGYDFNGGTLQGWTVDGPRDEDGNGPFASNFSASWSDAVNHPTMDLSDPLGDNRGSYKICNVGGHGITNPGRDWWYMYWFSPDLSSSTDWQNADGYSIKLLNAMDLIGAAPGDYLDLYINLRVTVYDHDEARNRYFAAYVSDRLINTWNEDREWIDLSYNWTGIYATVPNRTIKEVYISVMGSMSDYFEGGIYLDEVQPIITGGVPTMSVTPMELDFGETETLMTLDIHNTGGGTLEWNVTEVPDEPWLTVSPASGAGNATVEVTVDRALLEGSSGTTTLWVNTNGGQQDIPVTILGESTSPWKHPEIETKVLAGDGVEGDAFGRFLDIDGDYLIVGASDNANANGDSAGAAYIYKRSGDDWVEQQKLIASDGKAQEYFGYSVGISGDYAIVGACWDNDLGTRTGSAYIFKRDGETWTEEMQLHASDAAEDDRFAISAAIDGDYAVVGAFFDDDFGERTGSAYIFKREGETWTEQAKLVASDAAAQDWFGVCVAIEGDVAVIGSRYDDNEKGDDAGAAYVFRRSGDTWTEEQKLVASDGAQGDLFHKCAVDGDIIAVGSYQDDDLGATSGSAYLYKWDGSTWAELQKLTASDGAEGDRFGVHTVLCGNYLAVAAYNDDDNGDNSGSIYIYRYDGTAWAEDTKIIASDGEAGDQFGQPLAMDRHHIATASVGDDDKGDNSGSVYVYRYDNPYQWIRSDIETRITASDGEAYDIFGRFLDIDGDYLIVGASDDSNVNGDSAGAAYIYKRTGDNWVEQQKLIASDGGYLEYFGYSVGISGDYAIVGACWDDDHGDRSGSAYIFKREGETWTEQAKLFASDAAEDDRFAISAAIDGDYAIVGAFFDDDFGERTGSAYIFKREGETWTEQAKLLANDADAYDWFGVCVAIDGDVVVVGSRYDNNDKGGDAGGVYVFRRSGSTWTEEQKLIASDGQAGDLFHKCSVYGDVIVVGAYEDDDMGKNSGSAYVFEREEGFWTEKQKLTASDEAAGDYFGAHTDICGNYLVIGAYMDDDNGENSGSIYVFSYNGTEWAEETKIIASDGESWDRFGLPVAMTDETIAVGASLDDNRGTNAGMVYVYAYQMTTGVENGEKPVLPLTSSLLQNYPNPFNPNTTIQYQLAHPSDILLSVYDMLGREVRILVDSRQAVGAYEVSWDGKDSSGKTVPSGLYFYRLELKPAAGRDSQRVDTRKMVLMK